MLGALRGTDVGPCAYELELLLLTVQPFRNKRAERFRSHPDVTFFVLS
jgi:hypothetical protein